MQKTWLVTGSASGLGAAITRAALASGHRVIATDRDQDRLHGAFPTADEALVLTRLDITEPPQVASVVADAIAAFGRIDVLVNNAGYGQFGPFETNGPEDVGHQFAVNVFGTFHVTRAVLPQMRLQRAGHIFNMSSNGGLAGVPGASLYSATKFAIEGASEALSEEVAHFGIKVTLLAPGAFRTDFLAGNAIRYGNLAIDDYADYALRLREANDQRDQKQLGDPVKLGRAVVKLAEATQPPLHFIAGSDALTKVTRKIESLKTEILRWRELSLSTDSVD